MKHIIHSSTINDDDDDDDDVELLLLLKMTRPSESYVMERSLVSTSPPRAVAGLLAPRICGDIVSETATTSYSYHQYSAVDETIWTGTSKMGKPEKRRFVIIVINIRYKIMQTEVIQRAFWQCWVNERLGFGSPVLHPELELDRIVDWIFGHVPTSLDNFRRYCVHKK